MVNRAAPSPPPGPPVDLREVRDRALHATDVAVVVTDARRPGSPIVWVNDAFTRITGYPMAEVLGRGPDLLHGPETDREKARALGEAVRAGVSTTVTVRNYRRDGTPFWNQVSLSPVPDADGVVTHWVGIQVDVTDHVDLAVEQERSIVAERRARTGLALVSEVSDALAELDQPYVLRDVASLLRRELVGWAGFYVDDGGLRPAHGVDVGPHEGGRPRRGGTPGSRPGADPVQDLLDGRVEGPLELDLRLAAADGPDAGEGAGAAEESVPAAAQHGPTTHRLVEHLTGVLRHHPATIDRVVVHPVVGRRESSGVLVTAPRRGLGLAAYDAQDLTVLHLVARRVGMAIDNSRLYGREHRLAETLQRAMLPEQADVADLDVWTYYAPSSGHAQVGGDWYDVLQVAPGLVVLVIGDVVGHDVEAAATMGQLRSVVRSLAHDGGAPGAVLARVDQLVAGMRVPRSASLVLATMTRHDAGWTLRYSRAGHLPPVVAHGSQVETLTAGTGMMIGFGEGPRPTVEHELAAGDALVLYTDGLIERRDRTMRQGLAALVEATGRVSALDSAGIGEELLSQLADGAEDDVAVVVVRVPDPDADRSGAPDPRRRRWSLPSEPGSIARARHAVLRTCDAWEIPGAQSAELVVSELVANAVLHGWGHVVLRLYGADEGLRIEVEDANPAPPVTTDGHPGRVGGYGMRIVERLATWGWRPSGTGKLVWATVNPSPFGLRAGGAAAGEPAPGA